MYKITYKPTQKSNSKELFALLRQQELELKLLPEQKGDFFNRPRTNAKYAEPLSSDSFGMYHLQRLSM
jgi:hypothetical protein